MTRKKSNKLETLSGKFVTESQRKESEEQLNIQITLYDKDRWNSLFEKFENISEVPKLAYNLDIETLGDGFIYEKKEIEVDGFIYEKKEINIEKLKTELREIFDVYAFLRDRVPESFAEIKKNMSIIQDFEKLTKEGVEETGFIFSKLADKYNCSVGKIKSTLSRYRSLRKRAKHIKK